MAGQRFLERLVVNAFGEPTPGRLSLTLALSSATAVLFEGRQGCGETATRRMFGIAWHRHVKQPSTSSLAPLGTREEDIELRDFR